MRYSALLSAPAMTCPLITMAESSVRNLLQRLIFTLLLVLTVQASAADRPVIHVLFIGNSFIYFHNMPRVLEAISPSSGGPIIRTEMIAVGGARLKDHWDDGKALKAIQRGGWDFVVLNEQSSLGNILYINQKPEISDPAKFWKYAGLFDDAIRKSGAQTVILMTWKDKAAPERQAQALNYAFLHLAKERHAILAPVSLAWAQAVRTAPGVNLYFKDDHHPSEAGSYLEACALYATLTAARFSCSAHRALAGTPIEMDEGKVLEGKTEVLVDIPPDTARTIQQIAWDTAQQVKKAGGYPALPEPKPLVLPTVPRGTQPVLSDLVGKWSGPLRFYPGNDALTMELTIAEASQKPSARLHISYNKMRPDLDIALADFAITPNGIKFSDPDGPNKTVIKFDGAFLPGKLTGTATAIGLDADPSIAVFGTWEVKKK